MYIVNNLVDVVWLSKLVVMCFTLLQTWHILISLHSGLNIVMMILHLDDALRSTICFWICLYFCWSVCVFSGSTFWLEKDDRLYPFLCCLYGGLVKTNCLRKLVLVCFVDHSKQLGRRRMIVKFVDMFSYTFADHKILNCWIW